jgi:hypothetical protein
MLINGAAKRRVNDLVALLYLMIPGLENALVTNLSSFIIKMMIIYCDTIRVPKRLIVN